MGQLILNIKKTLYPAFNMLSGVLIRIFNPFKKGDFIEINGFLGSVEHKGYKQTTLKNIEGEEFKIANTLFYTKHLHNLTHENIVNVDLNIAINYAENMANAKQLIKNHLQSNTSILKCPAPKIFVRKIKNTHVELGIKVWCPIEKYLEVDAEAEVLLKEFLKAKGVYLEPENNELKNLMTA